MEWCPSGWGRRVTRSPHWSLRLDGGYVELSVSGQQYRLRVDDDKRVQIHPGIFWSRVELQTGKAAGLSVDGLPNGQASRLAAALQDVLFARTTRGRKALFDSVLQQIQSWLGAADDLIDRGNAGRRWITHEQQQTLLAKRSALPLQPPELERLFLDENVHGDLQADSHRAALDALRDWNLDWSAAWAEANEAMTRRELVLAKDFLDRVESKPLTEEQSRAVICFDNRVQVVAAAGSGKTSTMVAKAAYAIDRGFVEPERIVMLAFNKDAAKELEERAQRSFDRLGMGDTVVESRTFHALGLAIIAKATGRKPDIPEWATDATLGFNKLAELVDDLKDRSIHFRTQWDMFRLVFGRDLPPFGAEMEADGYDRDGTPYIRALQGERVKSLEECVIADWLFYNGVTYDYERRYEFDTATDTHRQYRPDFYYPDAGLYHEHFALDADGQPPAHFAHYADGMHWKRQQHAARGTALVETTSFGLRSGHALQDLAERLGGSGVELDPNPDRELPEQGAKPMPDADLIGLMRTFIAHAKSNCLTLDDMAERLRQMPEDQFKERHRRFLEIASPVFQAWGNALADEHGIDFEDMLNMAAGLLEHGRYESPYELVMADEFQDASRARARLCRALVSKPGRYLFAVGDDWQSINRFAGADVSVMTGFREWMGQGQVLKLEQTFRCPQALCDASSRFISRNPAQIAKSVRSAAPAMGPVLQAFQMTRREEMQDGVRQYLARLHQQLLSGAVPQGRNGRVTVFILGRYRADRSAVPPDWKTAFGSTMDVEFLTAHRSKGREADYVILPGMIHRGFPSLRSDDPVLSLAMPDGDTYPLSEERRLFYVALTRARRSVAMFTLLGKRSPFLDELMRDGAVEVTSLSGVAIHEERCPVCKVGVFVDRNGPHGAFRSCSSYPLCHNKPKGGRRG
ncbi:MULTISPECIES: UvrD-helicase domain-containing protein [Stenotrophomonas maltophilia group]|uniref:UvrD-helicase domain-containing protein n=1 Tax=Stenotrophomonas maltophilia group TaxID=995085 RepID=UPI0018D31CB6|nr:UvrD-helicase domain-containing protein [Stenotrophomonas maltophilia]HDS1300408.1 UvrD-helicase domain-containing protein [Stenotrophomonas maltophilia]HDS1521876.1 UvrD-helicase domain-containing protein [Stenotrophomonas maltophilia]HDS1656914.1 UvrD-helicase domain-containing protein [Stenotrophomonas maltophilia]HDS1670932.1 UvrD-helicase domain-containing protein [Stenotrophomonas maltophilia]